MEVSVENFIVRAAVPSDIPAIYGLICEMEEQTLPYQPFAAILQRQLHNPDYCCFVCEAAGMVAGVLNLRVEEQLHHAGMVAEIMELAVKNGFRSMGIGKRLIDAARQTAESLGCIHLEVSSNQRRTRAHAFYERQGLRKTHKTFTRSLAGME